MGRRFSAFTQKLGQWKGKITFWLALAVSWEIFNTFPLEQGRLFAYFVVLPSVWILAILCCHPVSEFLRRKYSSRMSIAIFILIGAGIGGGIGGGYWMVLKHAASAAGTH